MKRLMLAAAALLFSNSSFAVDAKCPSFPEGTIARAWHGRVPNAKASDYEKYLGDGVKKFPSIKGNRGYMVMMEAGKTETDFLVISFWDSKKSITGYAGDDISKVRSLPKDHEFLIEPEKLVKNYDIKTYVCN